MQKIGDSCSADQKIYNNKYHIEFQIHLADQKIYNNWSAEHESLVYFASKLPVSCY